MANFRFLGPFWYFYHLRKSDTNFRPKTSNNQRLGSVGDNDRKSKRFQLQRCALRKFHATDSQNTRVQITRGRRSKRTRSNCVLCIPFILSGKSKRMLTTYMRRMGNNNLEIRIAGSSCRRISN